jgi:hypothetical protein
VTVHLSRSTPRDSSESTPPRRVAWMTMCRRMRPSSAGSSPVVVARLCRVRKVGDVQAASHPLLAGGHLHVLGHIGRHDAVAAHLLPQPSAGLDHRFLCAPAVVVVQHPTGGLSFGVAGGGALHGVPAGPPGGVGEVVAGDAADVVAAVSRHAAGAAASGVPSPACPSRLHAQCPVEQLRQVHGQVSGMPLTSRRR